MEQHLWSAAYLRLAPAAALAVLVVIAADAFLGRSDALPGEVYSVLTQAHEDHQRSDLEGGIDVIHDCWPVSDAVRGIQIGLALLLFGGVPAAIVAAALRAMERHLTRPHCAHDWSNVFAGGLVLQLSSLAFTSLLLVVAMAVVVVDPYVTVVDGAPAIGVLLFCSTCSTWGLRSWRTLQQAAYEEPLRITAP